LLVAPVVEKGVLKRSTYLPAGTSWYDFFTGQRFAGGQTIDADAPTTHIPVFVRAGSIVPIGPVKLYADAPSDEPIELRVYPGADGAFALYDDAGNGYGYERGKYNLVRLEWNDRARSLTIAKREGSYAGMATATRFKLLCGDAPAIAASANYSGNAITIPLSACR
jgi:alpha-D-xyloside xylohydrolase